jgi:hypothetical protein
MDSAADDIGMQSALVQYLQQMHWDVVVFLELNQHVMWLCGTKLNIMHMRCGHQLLIKLPHLMVVDAFMDVDIDGGHGTPP